MATKRQIENYIRESAKARGIDPDTAVRVYRSEGGGAALNGPGGFMRSNARKNGIREPSYGPFQSLIGGPGTGFPKGQGNAMLAAGIDPRKPEDVFKAIDWSLNYAAQRGWSEWYGAKAVGIGRYDGLSGAKQVAITGKSSGPTMTASQAKTASLQQSLADIGYDIQVDGKIGPQTRAALKDFQTKTGLTATGMADKKTADAVYGANMLGLTPEDLQVDPARLRTEMVTRTAQAGLNPTNMGAALGMPPEEVARIEQAVKAPSQAVAQTRSVADTTVNPAPAPTRELATPEQMQASFTGERERIRADLERKLNRLNELRAMGAITPEYAAAARAKVSQQAQDALRVIDPSAGFKNPLPQTAPAAPPQGVAVDPVGVDAMPTTAPAMPTRATPSPVDPAQVTKAVREISMETPWAIPAGISPEGVVPGYPEYSAPVPTPRANPVRVSQTPELGFTPAQPVEPDKVIGPTMGPADYWTGKPEQPAQQYYEQDLKPLREPDAVIGPAADMAPPQGIAVDPIGVDAMPTKAPAMPTRPDLSQYRDQPLTPLSDVNISTAKIGTVNGGSTAIPTPRARPALAADAAPVGVRTGTFGGDMIGYNRATTSKSSSIGDTGLQAAQEAKAFADARQKANEAMGIGPVTDAQYASGRLSNAYANNALSKTQETPAGTRLAGYDKVSSVGYQTGKPAVSAYNQKMAELDAEDLSAGTMTPDDLAKLEAMRPANQLPAPMDLTPAQFGGPAYASSASGGQTFGSLANSMASNLDALGRTSAANAIRKAGSVNSAGSGLRGAYGGTAEQQARTAASLSRMAQAERAKSDRSARGPADRGNTYNKDSTLSGRERVSIR